MSPEDKWEFEDYAYTITGLIVIICLVVPEILYNQFGISILGGALDTDLGDIHMFRATSPLLFLLTTAVCFAKDAIVARRDGGYKGSLFTHTFESLLEDAIYMGITTIMVYAAVFTDAMYVSWLAGPVTWVLFIFIFPLVKKRRRKIEDVDDLNLPWLMMAIFAVGLIAEAITRAWIAFPMAWLIICGFKLFDCIRERDGTPDSLFNILYYSFFIILLAVGIGFDYWMASWVAFPFALFICWLKNKYRQLTTERDGYK